MSRFLVASVCLVLLVGIFSMPMASELGKLTIWCDEIRAPALRDVGAAFTAETGVEVEVVEICDQLRLRFITAALAGVGPDILIGAHEWIGELALAGLLEPVDLGDRGAEFNPTALEGFSYGGQLYGLPYGTSNVALIYNKALVLVPPQSFEELIQVAKELMDSGVSQYGFIMPNPDPYHWFPMLSAFGGYIFGENLDGTPNVCDIGLANWGAIKGAELFASMVEEGLLPANVHWNMMRQLFLYGNAGMIISGPWMLPGLKDAGMDYGITPIPPITTVGRYDPKPFVSAQGFMVSAFSENKEWSFDFLLDYIATKETMLALYRSDPRPPAYLPALEDPEVAGDPDIAAFAEQARLGTAVPNNPEMDMVWDALLDVQDSIATQEAEPADALQEAVELIGEALECPELGTKRYIVVFQDDVSDVEEVAREVIGQVDGLITHVYDAAAEDLVLKGASFTSPIFDIDPIRQDSRVKAVVPESSSRLQQGQRTPTGVHRIGADLNPTAWRMSELPEARIPIAVLDTGIDLQHPDLNVVEGAECTGRVLAGNAGFFGLCISGPPASGIGQDIDGHGTHVAGIAAAIDNGIGVVGVAPSAPLYAVKVCSKRRAIAESEEGAGIVERVLCPDGDVIAGILWVALHKFGLGDGRFIPVGNMSLGGPFPPNIGPADDGKCGLSLTTSDDVMHLAICIAEALDVTFTVSAGNDCMDTLFFSPGGFSEVISVAAITDSDGISGGMGMAPRKLNCTPAAPPDRPGRAGVPVLYRDDRFTIFSNSGFAPPDIAAPGVSICSTWPRGLIARGTPCPGMAGQPYALSDGTSMAAPHVAGAVALCISSGGCQLGPAAVKQTLLAPANVIPPSSPPALCSYDPTPWGGPIPLVWANAPGLGGTGICR